MAAQARRRPGSPDLERLEVDPEAGLAGIPPKSLPGKEPDSKDVKILLGHPPPAHSSVRQFMNEYGAVPYYGRRRKTQKKKKSRKAGRRKTRK